MKNAQAKGKNFEREIAKDLEKRFNTRVRRTPCSGAIHDFMSEDIICLDQKSILNSLHIECKKCQNLNAHKVFYKTKQLARFPKVPVVVWKKNDDPEPIVIQSYNDFCQMLSELEVRRKASCTQNSEGA